MEYDRTKDPALNDDSQPSVTSAEDVLRAAAENAGVPRGAVMIPAPADAVDMQHRVAVADQSVQEAEQELVAAQEVANERAAAVPERLGPGSPVTRQSAGMTTGGGEAGTVTTGATSTEAEAPEGGTGPYEGRTLMELRETAKARGVAWSGKSKAELIDALRA